MKHFVTSDMVNNYIKAKTGTSLWKKLNFKNQIILKFKIALGLVQLKAIIIFSIEPRRINVFHTDHQLQAQETNKKLQ